MKGFILTGVFFGTWIGFGVCASKQKLSKTLSIGGGFIAACVSMIIVGTMAPSLLGKPAATPTSQAQQTKLPDAPVKPKVVYGPGLGIDYKTVMTGLDKYFPAMENSPLASGEARMVGTADRSEAEVIAEIVGDLPKSVDRVHLSLQFFGKVEQGLNNIVIATIVARNTCPEWPDLSKKIILAISNFVESKPHEENAVVQLVHKEKKVIIRGLREFGLLFVTIKHISAPDSPVTSPSSSPMRKPPHNYHVNDGFDYGYEKAVTEEEKKKGLRVGDMMILKYLGERNGTLQFLHDYYGDRIIFECQKPCEFVKTMAFRNGVFFLKKHARLVQDSIILSASQDAENGYLKQYTPTRNGKPSSVWYDENKGAVYSRLPSK